MNRYVIGLLLVLFPWLAVAADSGSSLSLTPVSSDLSVMFLGNLFGVVDGVLHGSGSQIMGAIFTVFNSAVLALGGIVIMYTLIVGTMNTAHEGEMLGHKWSSIWIPVRSTAGLALLIPKASGYCLMQIFVMWVVVQGVGAADKVWGAALDYLNRGGAIIQTSMVPNLSAANDSTKLVKGASIMLANQVCMFGVQKILENTRKTYLTWASQTPSIGPCSAASKKSNGLSSFCDTAVPDLLATVDAPGYQSLNPTAAVYTLRVPYFQDTTGPYAFLNGFCGTINWNSLGTINVAGTANTSRADTSQLISMSRATAIQQMYNDLKPVAESMVNNAPSIVAPRNNSSAACPPTATSVYGIPYSAQTGLPCTIVDGANCSLWQGGVSCSGSVLTGQQAPLFNGTEFQSSMADYNGIMRPTVNLLHQISQGDNITSARAFIAKANSQGWLSAGSYFFDLVKLNGSATANANLTDTNVGLDLSLAPTSLTSRCANGYPTLCRWLSSMGGIVSPMNKITELLGATPSKYTNEQAAVNGKAAATVYGFTTNSIVLRLPGQDVSSTPTFAMQVFPSLAEADTSFSMPSASCNGVRIKFIRKTICIGRYVAKALTSMLSAFATVFNQILAVWVNNFIITIVSIPLSSLQNSFVNGVNYLTANPGANPIVALAQMGVYYINEPANLYVGSIMQGLSTLFIPIFGPIVFSIFIMILGLAMPLITAWLGVMLSVGFATAFYVPFLPYMLFTFGVLAWFMAVIEAMAAAPLVALAITHPEGEGILGNKGEAALMILMNVFLRPAMMIIGYIAAIALSYVSVWLINSGFSRVVGFIQNGDYYNGWAGLYVLFFSVIIYTSMYVTVVQKSFNLIYQLPDQVLRWIGGHAENAGHESAGWVGDTQKQVDKGGEVSDKGQQGSLEKTITVADKSLKSIKSSGGAQNISAQGGEEG